jgi:8-oxo-dGTP pyrophosphatase MutT (NUDIX family)
MYKVFFNDRKLFLTDNFAKHFQVRYGLFYKFSNIEDLKELIKFYAQLTRIESLYLFHTDIEEMREAFRQCFIEVNAGGGLVKNNNGEYLLIHRRGKWDLPKGKLWKNEPFEKAAVREVEEECGISGVKIVKPLLSTYHTYPDKEELVLKKTSWYEMHYSGQKPPTPQKEEDIQDVRWVSVKDLEPYLNESFPAIRDVFTYYGE